MSEEFVFAVVRPWVYVSACVTEHVQHDVLRTNWRNITKLWLMMLLRRQINCLSFEGRGVKVKVTARSNIWVSYCGGRRHPHRRLGVEVSSSEIVFVKFITAALSCHRSVVCLSVRFSVCSDDDVPWLRYTSKEITQILSLGSSLFEATSSQNFVWNTRGIGLPFTAENLQYRRNRTKVAIDG